LPETLLTLLPTGLVSLEPGLLAFTGLDLAGGGLEMNGAADLEERKPKVSVA